MEQLSGVSDDEKLLGKETEEETVMLKEEVLILNEEILLDLNPQDDVKRS